MLYLQFQHILRLSSTAFQRTRPYIAENIDLFPVACQQTQPPATLLKYKDVLHSSHHQLIKLSKKKKKACKRYRTSQNHTLQHTNTQSKGLYLRNNKELTNSKHLPADTADDSELFFSYSTWSFCPFLKCQSKALYKPTQSISLSGRAARRRILD